MLEIGQNEAASNGSSSFQYIWDAEITEYKHPALIFLVLMLYEGIKSKFLCEHTIHAECFILLNTQVYTHINCSAVLQLLHFCTLKEITLCPVIIYTSTVIVFVLSLCFLSCEMSLSFCSPVLPTLMQSFVIPCSCMTNRIKIKLH